MSTSTRVYLMLNTKWFHTKSFMHTNFKKDSISVALTQTFDNWLDKDLELG